MRFLRWIAALLVAAIMVDFALSNRETVLVGFWPLIDGLALPVYLALLLPLLLGLALGWLTAGWRSFRRRRAEKKTAP
jgi:lipopolysaccharide assembly protein A